MSKFRKKPVVIEATQWFKNGDHPEDDSQRVEDFGADGVEGKVIRYFRRPDVPGDSFCGECGQPFHVHGWIDTKEDGHRVCPGDWIITGVQGERYPCKPDIFAATYKPEQDSGERDGGREAAIAERLQSGMYYKYATEKDVRYLLAELGRVRAERDAACEALKEIAQHGITAPREMGDVSENAAWWKRIAFSCMATAARELAARGARGGAPA